MESPVEVHLTMEQAGAMNDFYRSVEDDLDGTPAGRAFEKIGDAYRNELIRRRRAREGAY